MYNFCFEKKMEKQRYNKTRIYGLMIFSLRMYTGNFQMIKKRIFVLPLIQERIPRLRVRGRTSILFLIKKYLEPQKADTLNNMGTRHNNYYCIALFYLVSFILVIIIN